MESNILKKEKKIDIKCNFKLSIFGTKLNQKINETDGQM